MSEPTPVILMEQDGTHRPVETGKQHKQGDKFDYDGESWQVVADAPNSHSQFAPIAVKQMHSKTISEKEFLPPGERRI